jgi:hypothetical protein
MYEKPLPHIPQPAMAAGRRPSLPETRTKEPTFEVDGDIRFFLKYNTKMSQSLPRGSSSSHLKSMEHVYEHVYLVE